MQYAVLRASHIQISQNLHILFPIEIKTTKNVKTVHWSIVIP